MEEIITVYESSVQSAIASTSANYYKDVEVDNFKLFNYHLSPEAKKRLSLAGLYLSPYSAMPHSHPVCKTLENYLLYKVLPNYIDNRFFFVGIKEFKLELLKKRDPQLDLVSSINRYVTSADKSRYGNDFVKYSSAKCIGLKRHSSCLADSTLRDLAPALHMRRAKHIFLHDEIHYWSAKDLITFLEVISPDVMYATLVYPPEMLVGSRRSLHNWCYEYEVVGKNLRFYPDGARTEGYEQPISGGFLLKTNRVMLPDGSIYCVDLIHSKFAHHLVCLTKGHLKTEERRTFGPFEATGCKSLSMLHSSPDAFFPVPFEVVSRLYRYLRSLKKPDKQSAMAKLSQLVPEPTGVEIKFTQDFADLVIKTDDLNSMIKTSFLRNWMGKWLGRLPAVFSRQFSSAREVALDTFVSELAPYCFTVKLEELNWGSQYIIDLLDEPAYEDSIDLVSIMDSFNEGSRALEFDRVRTPYSGLLNLVDSAKPLLALPYPALARTMVKLYCRANISDSLRALSRRQVMEVMGLWLQNGSMLIPSKLCVQWLGRAESQKQIIAHIKALANQRMKCTIYETGVEWFLDSRRAFTNYLTNFEDGVSKFRDLDYKYQELIVKQFRAGGGVPVVLKKCRYPTRITALSTGKPHRVEPELPIKTCNSEEVGLEVEMVKPPGGLGACSCGLSFQICPLLESDHCFVAPDELRGRKAGWYSNPDVAYSYNGGAHTSQGWPDWLVIWCEVNGVPKKYNSCLFQIYDEGAKIGFHTDDEEIFEEGESILTINLAGSATFGVKGFECTGNWSLDGACMFTMPAGFQRTHKHSVYACSNGRESVTLRVLKKMVVCDEGSKAIIAAPVEEHENERCFAREFREITVTVHELDTTLEYNEVDVPGDGNCFWHCMGKALKLDASILKRNVAAQELDNPELNQRRLKQMEADEYAEDEAIMACAIWTRTTISVTCPELDRLVRYEPQKAKQTVNLMLVQEHFTLLQPRNACVVEAIAQSLDRTFAEVLQVIHERCDDSVVQQLWSGKGLLRLDLDQLFNLFGIEGHLFVGEEIVVHNPGGHIRKQFELADGHLSFVSNKKTVAAPVLREKGCGARVPKSQIEALNEAGALLKYEALSSRADLLSRCLHDGSTGIMSSSLFNGRKRVFEPMQGVSQKEKMVCCILGTFGSGKSTLLRRFFKANPGKMITYVSPRKALAVEFKCSLGLGKKGSGKQQRKMGQNNWTVLTFEKFLLQADCVKSGCIVILDEIQLYPPGYLDLISFLLHEEVTIVVAGDPCQSDYDSERDRAFLGMLEADHVRLLKDQTYKFVTKSKRFLNLNLLDRLPCALEVDQNKRINEEYLLLDGIDSITKVAEEFKEVFLVSSFDEKKIVESYAGYDQRVLTYGESTGLTFNRGTILISNVSSMTSEQRWLTALSRFRVNLCLINLSGLSWPALLLEYRQRCLGKFLTGNASLADLSKFLPGSPRFADEYIQGIGRDEGIREEKMSGDPWLKGMIDLGQAEDMEDVEEILAEAQEQWFKVHLPQADLESVRAGWVHKIMAKEYREVRMGYLVSEQFTDDHSKQLGKRMTNAAERFETIYPRHRANDTVTFIMAVKKRLRFSNPAKEMAKLDQAKLYGKFLLDEFLKKIPLKREHNETMMTKAKWAFEEKKTSKSTATIENHSNRSCRDWLIDIGLIFSKSQLCTKFDNRFRVAKAAQSIVCFQHEVLCRFAPYMRYIEMKLQEVLPARYYIHSGKGLEELNEWVLRGGFDGVCTESDYEAFDASQDQYIVAFELAVMRYLGLPQSLINDYVFIKTHLGSKLGNFAIMRFSGEASTFLFNTMANMLFTFLRYDIKGDEYICFAGDDMCASKRLSVKREHSGFLDRLKLKAKVAFTASPTFCGWNLTPDGIYKKPQLVMERMCIAKETNNLANCIDNYAIEVSYAYRLGEKALCRMNEEEAEAMYNCVRIIVKNKHLLKSGIADLYTTNKGI